MPDINILKTADDFMTGNLEASPRIRVNRTAALTLSIAWQRVDFNGTSTLNLNSFPMSPDGVNQMTYYDTTNKLFKFLSTVDRNYDVSYAAQITASGIVVNNVVQLRYVIPNGISPGVDLYFPLPDSFQCVNFVSFAASTVEAKTDDRQFYINAAARANGIGVEIRLLNSLVLAQTVTMNNCNFFILGR